MRKESATQHRTVPHTHAKSKQLATHMDQQRTINKLKMYSEKWKKYTKTTTRNAQFSQVPNNKHNKQMYKLPWSNKYYKHEVHTRVLN
jgi:hypothetical protein